jgi:hypothetical protein
MTASPSRTCCLAALLCCAATAQAAVPDLTGIWSAVPGVRGPDLRESFIRDAPFVPAVRARVAEYNALIRPSGASPGAYCLGHGMPEVMLGSGGYPMEIIQRPEQMTLIHELHSEVRRIYTDGRKTDPNDLVPERNGYSTGHWEGDTLVVETISLPETVEQFTAHSAEAKVVERFTLSNDKGRRLLTDEITLIDPAFYTKPVTLTKQWAPSRSARILSYDCNEPVWEAHVEELRGAQAQKK